MLLKTHNSSQKSLRYLLKDNVNTYCSKYMENIHFLHYVKIQYIEKNHLIFLLSPFIAFEKLYYCIYCIILFEQIFTPFNVKIIIAWTTFIVTFIHPVSDRSFIIIRDNPHTILADTIILNLMNKQNDTFNANILFYSTDNELFIINH